MKAFSIVTSTLLSLTFAAAQTTRIVNPTPNTRIVAGQNFQLSAGFVPTTSSVTVLALSIGLRANDPSPTDLGQTILTHVMNPTFDATASGGQRVQVVNVTAPTDLINGLERNYTLTMAEFYLLGAENTASVFVTEIPVYVAGN